MNESNEYSKIKTVQKRFQLKGYEFVYGSEKVKSCIEGLGKKHGKHQFIDDPIFDTE